ncbi:MAG TPA: hypothetical protein DDW52_02400 [Planctomycetaceae bacterium]|nr:hypothetical protein [Planctomycetaceae bacterium]
MIDNSMGENSMVDWQRKLIELGIEETEFSPFTKETLAALESHYKAKLPAAFREFLETYGHSLLGVSTNISFGPDNQYGFGVSVFPKAEHMLNFETVDEVVPKKIVVFACDIFGNSACISLRPDTYGKVYWYDHNQVPSVHDVADDEEHFECLVFMAESFEDWVERQEIDE